MNKRLLASLAVPFSVALIAGCGGSSGGGDEGGGGGNGGGGNGPSVIEGTAATGAPYTGSDTILIICKGNDDIPMIVEADAQGEFSLSQEEFNSGGSQFPCTIALQSGTLQSYTNQSGRVNLTPFTTLAFKRALMDHSGQAGLGGLGGLDVDTVDPSAFGTELNTATGNVMEALKEASGKSSVPFDIFTATFKADHNSLYDRWLDGFGEALIADYPVPGTDFMDAFLSFPLKYSVSSTTTDPTSFDEAAENAPFKMTVPVPQDKAQYFKNALAEGDYTLEVGITSVGPDSPINETISDVALPASETEMCNRLETRAIEIITDGQSLSSGSSSCAWATTPPFDADKQGIVQYPPHGQAVFTWKLQ